MTNKKLKTPLFLAASLLLVGCSSDTIVARPTGWGDEKIIVNAGDKDNKMKNIYDAIKALGDTNSNVLNKVIYDISKTAIGKFIKDDDKDTDLTLYDIHAEIVEKGTSIEEYAKDSNFRKFVDSHSKYKAEDTSAKLNGTTAIVETLSTEQKYQVSLKKILNQYDDIVENIYEKLFEDIKGGSYSTQTHKLFDEKLYYQHLKKELYEPKELSEYTTNKAFLPKTKGESWVDYVNVSGEKGYLHVVNNSSTIPTSSETYGNYIIRKILPELYKTYLTETYVKEQRYSSLGRSYARKVNMITIAKNDTYKDKILNMINYFAKTYITGESVGSIEVNYDFEDLTKAMIGFAGTSTEGTIYKLLNNTPTKTSNFTPIKVYKKGSTTETTNFIWKARTDANGAPTDGGEDTYVYYGTKLGDLVENYLKIYDVTWDGTANPTSSNFAKTPRPDSEKVRTAYNDITNNGAYPLETGLAVKEKDMRLTDMTKDGWFLKNGGLTDLDSTFRDRLFNISTSNDIDNNDKKKTDGFEAGDYIRYFGEAVGTTLKKAKAFLTTSTLTYTNPWESIVLIGDSNYYIVEVEEAANTSKLSNANNAKSYYKQKTGVDAVTTADTVDKLTREVVKANSTSDTYKKNANEYYLMISNIVFYDQSVYDYFKSQFPDLFK